MCDIIISRAYLEVLRLNLIPFLFRIQFLRHIRDFFQVMFKIDVVKEETEEGEEELRLGGDKIVLTCVGAGFRNLNKVIL